ncbi:putative oxidoreductase [Devosia subaequoris]|uniref:Putative oxidoreductase n=1 Tax=Devosia subaequoris TaxID=395930 RepID=A0A7W6IRJ8_9HYPH|nr:DoxX family protein [Devosia subaequoris]MBB4053916.1 putative oxidoreductase [Devosia subaequoris]MCP1211338.1 DoxX family protein [Devosia subaequoris]
MFDRAIAVWNGLDKGLSAFPAAIPLLALRIALAIPFWRSGLTKWDGFLNLSSGARYLFEQEFKLHIFGQAFAYPAPLAMAFLAGLGEIILPILLVLGLGTRFAALGILGMTIIIQLTVPDGLVNFHLPWFAMALALLVYGGGTLSADRLLGGILGQRLKGSAHPAR